MDKKMFALLIVIVMIVAAFAGCSEESKSNGPPAGNKASGSMEPQTGWIASSGDSEPWSADATFQVSINATNVLSIEVLIRIEDADAEHSETDEGGTPDEIEVYITSQSVQTAPLSGATPFSTNIRPTQPNATSENEDTGEYFSSEWEIHISANCYSGKNPKGPGGLIPIPFLQYIDQGITYTYEVKYTYEEFE